MTLPRRRSSTSSATSARACFRAASNSSPGFQLGMFAPSATFDAEIEKRSCASSTAPEKSQVRAAARPRAGGSRSPRTFACWAAPHPSGLPTTSTPDSRYAAGTPLLGQVELIRAIEVAPVGVLDRPRCAGGPGRPRSPPRTVSSVDLPLPIVRPCRACRPQIPSSSMLMLAARRSDRRTARVRAPGRPSRAGLCSSARDRGEQDRRRGAPAAALLMAPAMAQQAPPRRSRVVAGRRCRSRLAPGLVASRLVPRWSWCGRSRTASWPERRVATGQLADDVRGLLFCTSFAQGEAQGRAEGHGLGSRASPRPRAARRGPARPAVRCAREASSVAQACDRQPRLSLRRAAQNRFSPRPRARHHLPLVAAADGVGVDDDRARRPFCAADLVFVDPAPVVRAASCPAKSSGSPAGSLFIMSRTCP